jgi:hypothetical protein
MLNKMRAFVQYYLGKHADSIPDVVLTHLARRLDDTGYTYCCFWCFLLGHWEKNKLIHKNFLTSPKVWQSFLDYRATKPAILKTAVGIELDRFRVEAHDRGPEETLRNTQIAISPLLRYTMAHYLGLTPEYKEQAIQQLREEPLLFEMMPKLIEWMPITKEEVMRND